MKNIFTLVLSFFILISCSLFSKKNGEVQNNQEKKLDSTVTQNNLTKEMRQASSPDDKNKISDNDNGIKILVFDKNSIPKDCEFKGNIIDGA